MKHDRLRKAFVYLFTFLLMIIGTKQTLAQYYMNISFNDGTIQRYSVNTIDSIWYDVDIAKEPDEEPLFTLSDGYIFYKNGGVYSGAGWKCSNYILIDRSSPYCLNISFPGNNAGYAFYDANKNYISGSNTITNDTIVSPATASYLRFCVQNQYADQLQFYALEGKNESDSDTNNTENNGTDTNRTQQGDNLSIKNNNQNQRAGLPNGSYLMNSNGKAIDIVPNYGNANQVLVIPVNYTSNKTMVIRFRVKFNEDLNKRSSEIDYNAENPNLLNFFTMSNGTHKVRLGVLPDSFINPLPKPGFESYGQGVGLQGTTKIKAVSANNTSCTDQAHVTSLTFDNYRFKTLTGGKLMSVRWLDNTAASADVCISNDGKSLKFYHSSNNSVIFEYTLSNYATLADLYNAMQENSTLEVRLCSSETKTPADLIEFSGIQLAPERNVVDGAGIMGSTYPTKTVYDNAPLYILDKIDYGWHTVEIAADRAQNSGVFCCCVDGTYLYAGSNPERISYYDGDTVSFYFGGDENGTKVNCSIKDIEIKYDNLEETEIVSYNSSSRVQIISDWHPKVFVLEGHNFSDTELGGQSQERMETIFNTLTTKRYHSMTLDELQNWVVNGVANHKRMFYAIYDDHQYEIYLNPQLKNLHNRYNVHTGLAEITNQTWWDYDGTRYQVSDINDSMINDGWVPLTHTKHQIHNTMAYEDLVEAITVDSNDLISYHIPKKGLVWPGGQSNVMCQELVEEYVWSMAFDIYRSGYYASITDAVKRCDKPMMLPRFVISNRIGISSILQEIQ